MALLWFEGFELFSDNNQVSDIIGVESNAVSFGDYGRNGRGIIMNSGGERYGPIDLSQLGYTDTDHTTMIAGFAWKPPDVGVAFNSDRELIRFWPNVQFHYYTGSVIRAYRCTDWTVLGTGSLSPTIDEWNYIQFKVYFHNTNGTIETWLNGAQDLNLTGLDTIPASGGISGCEYVRLKNSNRSGNTYFDDFYVCNGQGSKNNDFLGDVRVDVLRPSGTGANSDFIPLGDSSLSPDNYLNVDESPGHDEDTTYNYSGDVNDKDTYAMDDLPSPTGVDIHGVKTVVTARKDDAGVRKMKPITRVGGTDYQGDEKTLLDSYVTWAKVQEDNPDASSGEWDDSDVNGMEVGIQITA